MSEQTAGVNLDERGAEAPEAPSESWGNLSLWRVGVFAGLVAVTVYLCQVSPDTEAGDSAGVIMRLPDVVLEFAGEKADATPEERKVLPPDTEFEKREYRSVVSDTDEIFCTIVLSGKDRRSIHRPEVCLDAQGWTLGTTEVLAVPLKNQGSLRVSYIPLSRKEAVGEDQFAEMRAVYVYWFVGKDRTMPDSMSRVILTAWDNVFRSVNHRWAYVSVMSPVREGMKFAKNEEETVAMVKRFIGTVAPQFQTAF